MVPTRVVLVTQDGCSACQRAKDAIGRVRRSRAEMEVEEIQFASDEGMRLVRSHGLLYPPAILVDGRLVAGGRDLEQNLRSALG